MPPRAPRKRLASTQGGPTAKKQDRKPSTKLTVAKDEEVDITSDNEAISEPEDEQPEPSNRYLGRLRASNAGRNYFPSETPEPETENKKGQLPDHNDDEERIFLKIGYEDGVGEPPTDRDTPSSEAEVDTDLEEAKKILKIRDEDMAALLDNYRIPHHFGKLAKGKKGDHHSASSVTRKLLEKNGEWNFSDTCDVQMLATSQLYALEHGEKIDPNVRPQVYTLKPTESVTGQTNDEEKQEPRRYHKRVVAAITLCKRRIEGSKGHPSTLEIPEDWLEEEPGDMPLAPPAWRKKRASRFETPPPGDIEIKHLSGLTVYEDVIATPPRLVAIKEATEDTGTQLDDHSVLINRSSLEETEHTAVLASEEATKVDISKFSIDSAAKFREPEEWKALQATRNNIGDLLAERMGFSLLDAPGEEQMTQLDLALKPYRDLYEIKYTKKALRELFGSKQQRDQPNHPKFHTFPNIIYTSRESILQRSIQPLEANVTLNEYPDNLRFSSAHLINKWATFLPLKEKIYVLAKASNPNEKINEIMVERNYGNLIPGIFHGEGRQEIACGDLSFILPLRLFDTTPKPDFVVRLCGDAFASKNWPNNLLPVVFSADAKRDRNDNQVEAQLAMNSYGTLVLLILMYLDVRVKADGRIPGFLWIPAVVYHPDGFMIVAHHPKIEPANEDDWKWQFCSRVLSNKFNNSFIGDEMDLRMTGYTAMLKLRSHSIFLQQELEKWVLTMSSSSEKVIDQLIARGHLETGNRSWVLEAAKKVQAEANNADTAI